MTVSICTTHKPSGSKIYNLFQPKEKTLIDEIFVYERLLEALKLTGIVPDKVPLDLNDAIYESEIYIVQVNIYAGHNISVV